MSKPRAREGELLVRQVDEETLVYDLERHKAHCLNRTAVLVWRSCDGRRSPEDIAAKVSRELGTSVSGEVVSLALRRLGRARLLTSPWPARGPEASQSRRAALRKIALAGGLALPAVWSIVAPTAAYAATGCNTNDCMGGVADDTCCCDSQGRVRRCINGMCGNAPGSCAGMCPGQCT